MPPKKGKTIDSLSGPHPRAVVRFRPADWSPVLIASGLSAEPYTLHYFAIRGLGELPRLMLELAQMPYDSVLYWDTKEFKAAAPFGQMPLFMGGDLEDADQVLCQSSSIVRYIAKEANLDGSEQGAVGESRADMVFECSKDLGSNKNAIHTQTDADKEKFHGMLTKASELLDEYEGPFFSGMAATYGDVGMFHSLSTVEELKPGYLKANGFEDLSAFVTMFAELPPIAAYLASSRRMPLTNNEVGDVPWAADGYKYKTPLNAELYAEEYVETTYQLRGDGDDDDDDDDDEMAGEDDDDDEAQEGEEEEEVETVNRERPAKKSRK
ncbi:hypothetical protein KFE25_006305 [Diacronema lutheri]|uniref:GST N-terminal domain-containing protein n=1 Tax=Diacronema lutheri TaxID=2081491 RepID=A0A8J6CH59_DIALT|nr:hypothetical protein KFE25_006305 [Diacronema lutheri]